MTSAVRRRLLTFAAATACLLVVGGTSPADAESIPTGNYQPRFTFAGLADWDGDGHQDIVARDRAGVLWLYPGDGVRAYSSQAKVPIGNGWNSFTFAGIADWDADGHQDIVARDAAGVLWLYPGDSVRGYSSQARVPIGNSWNGLTFAGIADWDGDGNQDIIVRTGSGLLRLYPGESVRGYSGQGIFTIGNGWNNYTFAGLADWDGDGHQDIVTLATDTAKWWVYPGESVRAYSSQGREQLGAETWECGFYCFRTSPPTTFAGVADWDGDGHQDIITRNNATGDLWLWPGTSVRGFLSETRAQIGNGW